MTVKTLTKLSKNSWYKSFKLYIDIYIYIQEPLKRCGGYGYTDTCTKIEEPGPKNVMVMRIIFVTIQYLNKCLLLLVP